MAPRSKQPAKQTPARGAPKLKPTGYKPKAAATKAPQEPILLPSDAVCSTCEQSFGSIEKDWLPDKSVEIKWTKFNNGPPQNGRRTRKATGHECYYCLRCRIKNNPGKDQESIIELRKETTFREVSDQERRQQVRGEARYVRRGGGVETEKVNEKTQDFDSERDRGFFYLLRDYCRLAAPDMLEYSDKDIFAYGQQNNWHLDKDSQGRWGVKESNLPQGAIYSPGRD